MTVDPDKMIFVLSDIEDDIRKMYNEVIYDDDLMASQYKERLKAVRLIKEMLFYGDLGKSLMYYQNQMADRND